jgi:hypothetical protein
VSAAILAIRAISAFVFGLSQRSAGKSREIAASALSQVADDPTLSLALAYDAVQRHKTAEAITALRRAIHDSRDRSMHHNDPTALYSPDGKHVLTAGGDGNLRLWDRETLRNVVTSDRKHQGLFKSVRFNREGTRIVTAGGNEQAERIRQARKEHGPSMGRGTGKMLQSRRTTATLMLPSSIMTETSWPSLAQIAQQYCGFGSAMRKRNCKMVAPWVAHPITAAADALRARGNRNAYEFFTVAFNSNGRLVATGGSDRLLRVWNVAEARLDRTLSGHTGEVTQVAFSPMSTSLS